MRAERTAAAHVDHGRELIMNEQAAKRAALRFPEPAIGQRDGATEYQQAIAQDGFVAGWSELEGAMTGPKAALELAKAIWIAEQADPDWATRVVDERFVPAPTGIDPRDYRQRLKHAERILPAWLQRLGFDTAPTATMDDVWAAIEAVQPVADRLGFGTAWSILLDRRAVDAARAARAAAGDGRVGDAYGQAASAASGLVGLLADIDPSTEHRARNIARVIASAGLAVQLADSTYIVPGIGHGAPVRVTTKHDLEAELEQMWTALAPLQQPADRMSFGAEWAAMLTARDFESARHAAELAQRRIGISSTSGMMLWLAADSAVLAVKPDVPVDRRIRYARTATVHADEWLAAVNDDSTDVLDG